MGSICLSDSDVRAVLNTARGLGDAATVDVAGLLASLAALVPSDVVFWNHLALGPPVEERALVSAADRTPVSRAPLDPWLDHLPEHPIMSGRFGPVTAISDVLSERQFRSTWLYQTAFRPEGLRHEIGLELPHGPQERNVVVFSRGSGPDFSERDHLVLHLLRPHVSAALHHLSGTSSALTPRQLDVLRMVGEGLSDAQVARRLGIAERTVGKHLEHIYARTGAHTRLQAAARAGVL